MATVFDLGRIKERKSLVRSFSTDTMSRGVEVHCSAKVEIKFKPDRFHDVWMRTEVCFTNNPLSKGELPP
jgi:hypothetical protein